MLFVFFGNTYGWKNVKKCVILFKYLYFLEIHMDEKMWKKCVILFKYWNMVFKIHYQTTPNCDVF